MSGVDETAWLGAGRARQVTLYGVLLNTCNSGAPMFHDVTMIMIDHYTFFFYSDIQLQMFTLTYSAWLFLPVLRHSNENWL